MSSERAVGWSRLTHKGTQATSALHHAITEEGRALCPAGGEASAPTTTVPARAALCWGCEAAVGTPLRAAA